MSWLWSELSDFFAIDDGSLCDLRLVYSEPQLAAAGFVDLLSRSSSHSPLELWSPDGETAVPVDNPTEAGRLVTAEGARMSHLLASGVSAGGVALPDLGVWLWPGELELDYRMGSGWNAGTVDGLFRLMLELAGSDSGVRLEIEEAASPKVKELFSACWERFRRESGR